MGLIVSLVKIFTLFLEPPSFDGHTYLKNPSSAINKYLLSLLEKHNKDDNTELEAIIWGANFNDKKINHHSFIDVINFLKNELELTFINTDSLTIQTNSSSIRTTINGIDNIKMYWLRNELTDATDKSN